MPFQIVRNDITKMNTEVIVTPANAEVLVGGGVDSAVYRAAGWEELLEERRRAGRLKAGDVAVTSGGRLSCRYLFHACGPVYEGGDGGELRACYEKCLALAVERQCGSIAFPLLSAGSNGYPGEQALEVAVSAFRDFLMTHDLDIYLVVFDGETTVLSGRLFSEVRAYVDEHYVEAALEEEYPKGRSRLLRGAAGETADERKAYDRAARKGTDRGRQKSPARGLGLKRKSSAGKDAEKEPIKRNCLFGGRAAYSREIETDNALWEDGRAGEAQEAADMPRPQSYMAAAAAAPVDLDTFIHQNTGSFGEYLQQLINRKGMTNAKVYKKANLTKQYFSKVIHGQVKPAKEKLLCIAVALELNLDETADFLRTAGFALSPYSKTDLVFEYFIARRNFDIFSIDIALFDCGLPSLMD